MPRQTGRVLALCCALLLLPSALLAQGVGTWMRPDCTTLTSPVTGQTWCFDSTARVLTVWNGSAYVAGVAGSSGQVLGLTGSNNAGAPTTRWDFAAVSVQLRRPTDGTMVVRTTTGTLTNDTTLAGPAANGRDQAGAFAASTPIQVYIICCSGTTLASLSSVVAPPTGPTLPSGYTSWAYAGAVTYDAASLLLPMYWAGSRAIYKAASRDTQASPYPGSSTTAAQITIAPFVPANALAFDARATMTVTNGTVNTLYLTFLGVDDTVVAGAMHGLHAVPEVITHTLNVGTYPFTVPNLNQNLWYAVSDAAVALYVSIGGFTMPNGGE